MPWGAYKEEAMNSPAIVGPFGGNVIRSLHLNSMGTVSLFWGKNHCVLSPKELRVLLADLRDGRVHREKPSPSTSIPTSPTAMICRKGDGRQHELERAHCQFLQVDYPPGDRVAKEQFDRAITRQIVLSEKQWQAARLVASGLCDKEISARLDISERGVKTHLQAVRRKANISSRTQMVLWYLGVLYPKV